jgi:predicted nucleic acid-binding protein
MCLIVDVNLIHRIFPRPTSDFRPIHKAIYAGRATIVYGGYITEEYRRTAAFARLLKVLDSQGRARHIDDNRVIVRTAKILKAGILRSDDPHILALAQISGARLLCSHDNPLAADFTNHKIISNPRGKVYRKSSHSALIKKCC